VLVLGGDERPPVRVLEARRPRVAVGGDDVVARLPRRREQAELRGPGA
jgi:hypothetical protein